MGRTRNLTLSALFLAIGMVLPFFTGQIPEIGKMLLPMHIPVLLCGYICGWKQGALVGFILPILRSVTIGMPILIPVAVTMAFELAVYGMVVGLLYQKLRNRPFGTYLSLVGAMLTGRLVWGLVSILIYGMQGNAFTLELFLAGAFLKAIPGILLQLVLIPPVVVLLQKRRTVEAEA